MIENGQKLSDRHINFAQTILRAVSSMLRVAKHSFARLTEVEYDFQSSSDNSYPR